MIYQYVKHKLYDLVLYYLASLSFSLLLLPFLKLKYDFFSQLFIWNVKDMTQETIA